MLIDTHIHLNFPDFSEDLEAVMKQARSCGVEAFVNIGADLSTSRESIELSERHEDIFASVGIHPHDAKCWVPEMMGEFEKMIEHPKVVAIGEAGLDFFRDHSPREIQREVFRKFIQLHQKAGKVLVIHCRDAYDEMVDLLKEQLAPPFKVISHCFSSDREDMIKLLDLGFWIAFGGALTYKKNDALREAFVACPQDRILFETDAPYLPPQSQRGKRNEPAYLVETVKFAANLRRVPFEKLAGQTSLNAKNAFKL